MTTPEHHRAPNDHSVPTDHSAPTDAGTDAIDPTAWWDARYGEQDTMWRFRPNAVLATEAVRFTPGRALDLGAGEGGDAIWLAQRGWTVTATDISRVALDRGASVATDRGVADRVRWQQVDLDTWTPSETYDLVTSHFLHSPVALRAASVLRAATAAVAPGGHLLVVKHGAVPGGAPTHTDTAFPGPDEVVAQLELEPGAWRIELAERRQRDATLADGSTVPTEDVVVLVSRTGARSGDLRTASRSGDEDGRTVSRRSTA